MKVAGDCSPGEVIEGVGSGCGRTVVVGVRLDSQSRELLTWTLVNIAHSGDRVIALHVYDPASDLEGISSQLARVKTFDSVLAVYEGFCNLKQVVLKLKVCRGASVSKIVVQEAKSYAASTVVVGTSLIPHTIRSSVSVAKFCAKKLSKGVSVLAVDNGKIVFQREAEIAVISGTQDDVAKKRSTSFNHRPSRKNLEALNDSTAAGGMGKLDRVQRHLRKSSSLYIRSSLVKKIWNCAPDSVLSNELNRPIRDEDEEDDNSLALVPTQVPETEEPPQFKNRWPHLRRALLRSRQSPEENLVKKTSLVQWLLNLTNHHSSSVVYPVQKQTHSDKVEAPCCHLDGDNGVLSPLLPSNGSKNFREELEGFHEKYSAFCRLFSYQELLLATSNFKQENMVGKGGSSWVYKGSLPDGKELAVKKLKPCENVLIEFVSEVEIISTFCHKNVVSLLGFCIEDNSLYLVYDYLSRGTLEDSLHGNKLDGSSFGWAERYKVAVGVAEALNYLHNGVEQPIIHRDVKSSNILLCDNFEPQLSDFGFSQRASTSSSNIISNDVAGTFGYMAPEYFMHGKVTEKVDVYAFGVVLLELLSGRKPISYENLKRQESLVMWANPIIKDGKVSQLLDPSLGSKYESNEFERMVLAATLCIRRAAQSRPQMSLILKLLQGDEEVNKWAHQQINDWVDCEVIPCNIQSHLALLDLEDDSVSTTSTQHNLSIEDYLQGRWSRTTSFD